MLGRKHTTSQAGGMTDVTQVLMQSLADSQAIAASLRQQLAEAHAKIAQLTEEPDVSDGGGLASVK
jgi:hypothetical protein